LFLEDRLGRPSEYSEAIVAVICDRLVAGESLKRICDDAAMPNRSTVFDWLRDRPEFANRYARAREAQADNFVDEIVSIADTETDPQIARNRIDARKWVAGKMRPKIYGDRAVHEHGGVGGGPILVATGIDRSPGD
jgi:hypothetical protein